MHLSQKNKDSLAELKAAYNKSMDFLTIPSDMKKALNAYHPENPDVNVAMDICKAFLKYEPSKFMNNYSFMNTLDHLPLIKSLLLIKETKQYTSSFDNKAQEEQLLGVFLGQESPVSLANVFHDVVFHSRESGSVFVGEHASAYMDLFSQLPTDGTPVRVDLIMLFLSAQKHLPVETIEDNFKQFWQHVKQKTVEVNSINGFYFRELGNVEPAYRQSCFLFALKTGYYGPWQGFAEVLSTNDNNDKLRLLHRAFNGKRSEYKRGIFALVQTWASKQTNDDVNLLMKSESIWSLLKEEVRSKLSLSFESQGQRLAWMFNLLIEQSRPGQQYSCETAIQKLEQFASLLREDHYDRLRSISKDDPLLPDSSLSYPSFWAGYTQEIVNNGRIVFSQQVDRQPQPQTTVNRVDPRRTRESECNIIEEYVNNIIKIMSSIRFRSGDSHLMDVILMLNDKNYLDTLSKLDNLRLLLGRLDAQFIPKLSESLGCTTDELTGKLQQLSTNELQTLFKRLNEDYIENWRLDLVNKLKSHYPAMADVVSIMEDKHCLSLSTIEEINSFFVLIKEQGEDQLIAKLTNSLDCTQETLIEKLKSLSADELQAALSEPPNLASAVRPN